MLRRQRQDPRRSSSEVRNDAHRPIIEGCMLAASIIRRLSPTTRSIRRCTASTTRLPRDKARQARVPQASWSWGSAVATNIRAATSPGCPAKRVNRPDAQLLQTVMLPAQAGDVQPRTTSATSASPTSPTPLHLSPIGAIPTLLIHRVKAARWRAVPPWRTGSRSYRCSMTEAPRRRRHPRRGRLPPCYFMQDRVGE